MAPLDIGGGTLASALVFLAIGFGFGAVLEMGGFGDTRKLAGQFYFRDLTVLRVMFTAIAVAAVLVAGATGFGLLDMSRVWVNPTYLWPGIAGGLIMGVGFAVGGFCPGTSVVAASTLKIDGMVFLLGVVLGIWSFGETVSAFSSFFISSAMGRFTLADWLGVPTGVAVLLVVLVALLLFRLAGWAQRALGHAPAEKASGRPMLRRLGAAALAAAAAVVLLRGQPTPTQRFHLLGPELARQLSDRAPFVHPAEVVALRKELSVQVEVLDLREERDFNLFHLGGARRVDPEALQRREGVKPLLDRPASTVTFLVGNGERTAVEAWKALKGQGVGNVYVVEGGINRWLELYPAPACVARRAGEPAAGPEPLAWRFAFAAGSRLPASWPELPTSRSFRVPCETPGSAAPHGGGHEDLAWPVYTYARRVQLQAKSAVKGGCG